VKILLLFLALLIFSCIATIQARSEGALDNSTPHSGQNLAFTSTLVLQTGQFVILSLLDISIFYIIPILPSFQEMGRGAFIFDWLLSRNVFLCIYRVGLNIVSCFFNQENT